MSDARRDWSSRIVERNPPLWLGSPNDSILPDAVGFASRWLIRSARCCLLNPPNALTSGRRNWVIWRYDLEDDEVPDILSELDASGDVPTFVITAY